MTFAPAREQLIGECQRHCDFSRVAFYAAFKSLLARRDLEAVILAPPIRLNAPFAKQALAAAACAASTLFMLGFEFRHAPLTERILAALRAGDLGDLRLMWWNIFRMPFRASYRTQALG